MKIYYVVPPKGKTYRSQADAQAAFEAGEVWRCTGWATVEDGKISDVQKYGSPQPARYTQGDRVELHDESIVYVPFTWALQWKPGRVSLLRYSVRHGQRKVSYHYGPGQGKALVKEREPSGHEVRRKRAVVRKQLEARELELKREGGWLTSGGLRFFYSLDLKWRRRSDEDRRGPVYFDANPACRTLGDRELEKWFTSAQHRAYNGYAAEQQLCREYHSDDVLDPEVRYFPKLI